MNKAYRTAFVEEVKALPRNKHNRISYTVFEALNSKIGEDYKAGLISLHDFLNCRCVIGYAVNDF